MAMAFTALREMHVAELKRSVMQEVLYRANWPAEKLDEVVLGNVIMPADAANLARVAAIYAGIPGARPGIDSPAELRFGNGSGGRGGIAHS